VRAPRSLLPQLPIGDILIASLFFTTGVICRWSDADGFIQARHGNGEQAAVKGMLADGVYPPIVDISPETLKASTDTQIALGNLTAEPDCKTLVGKKIHRTGARDEIGWIRAARSRAPDPGFHVEPFCQDFLI
jgi:hypothetical protein